MRLDRYLVDLGYFESRNRAIEAVRSGKVMINGHTVNKPSHKVSDSDKIKVTQDKYYISRAAKKLEGFLDSHPLNIAGKEALDIGSSTGGFTQILLERGAASVDCVDVGCDQLHGNLRADKKVSVYEQTDIRDFYTDKKYEIIVSDVSFISLLHILPSIDRLAAEGADIVLLFKPQFEVGKDTKRDSKGVVTDQAAINAAMKRLESAANKLGWKLAHKTPSTITGKEGNRETVYHFVISRTPQTHS